MAGTPVVILGNGGHAQVLADAAGKLAIMVGPGENVEGGRNLVFGFVDWAEKKRLINQIGVDWFVPVIHPSAVIGRYCVFGRAPQIMAGVIVQPHTKLGDFVVLNTGCQVDHHGDIGDFVFIGPGAVLCGTVTVKPKAYIGAGATIIQHITVGENATVGAGAVVIRDVPDNAIVVGNPAKLLRMKRADE